MKKLMVGLVVVIILIGATLALALYNANSLVQRFKPDLEALASKTLETPVKLGELEVQIFPASRIEVKELSIGEGLKLNNFLLNVKLLPLLSKKLEIKKLSLLSPTITLLKDKSGVRVEGLKQKSADQKEAKASVSHSNISQDKKAPTAPLAIALESIQIENGALIIKELEKSSEQKLTNLDLDANVDLSGSEIKVPAFEFSGLVENKGNFKLSGSDIVFDTHSGKLDAKNIVADALGAVVAASAQYDTKAKTGNFNVNSQKVQFSGKPIDFKLSGSVQDQKITVSSFDAKAFSGVVQANAVADLGPAQFFQAAPKVSNLQIGEALAALKPQSPPLFEGTLVELATDVKGNPSALPSSLNGQGAVHLADGLLKGINLAAAVTKATKLPFLGDALHASVPPEFKPIFEAEDTQIKKLSADFKIANSAISTSNFILVSQIFTLDAAGTAGFDSSVDMKANIAFEPKFSKALTERVKEMSALLDKQGSLVIPLAIQGTLPKVAVLPNVEKLVQAGAGKLIEEKAGKFLEQLGGGKKEKNSGVKGLLGF